MKDSTNRWWNQEGKNKRVRIYPSRMTTSTTFEVEDHRTKLLSKCPFIWPLDRHMSQWRRRIHRNLECMRCIDGDWLAKGVMMRFRRSCFGVGFRELIFENRWWKGELFGWILGLSRRIIELQLSIGDLAQICTRFQRFVGGTKRVREEKGKEAAGAMRNGLGFWGVW